MPKKKTEPAYKTVETIKHTEASRVNIPTAEYQSVMRKDEQSPIRVAYERRNRDLDPQLVWRGKDEQDWSDLVVHAPPLHIQEKVHPKVRSDDAEDIACWEHQEFVLFPEFFATDEKGRRRRTFLQPTWLAKNTSVCLVRPAWSSEAGGYKILVFQVLDDQRLCGDKHLMLLSGKPRLRKRQPTTLLFNRGVYRICPCSFE